MGLHQAIVNGICRSQLEKHLRTGVVNGLYSVEIFTLVLTKHPTTHEVSKQEAGFCVYQGTDEAVFERTRQMATLLINQLSKEAVAVTLEKIAALQNPTRGNKPGAVEPRVLGPDGRPVEKRGRISYLRDTTAPLPDDNLPPAEDNSGDLDAT